MRESAYEKGLKEGLNFARKIKEEAAENISFDQLFEKIVYYIVNNDGCSSHKSFLKEKVLSDFTNGFSDSVLNSGKFICIRRPDNLKGVWGSNKIQLADYKVLAEYTAFRLRFKKLLRGSLVITLHSQREIKITPYENIRSITSFSIFDCKNNEPNAARTYENDKVFAAKFLLSN